MSDLSTAKNFNKLSESARKYQENDTAQQIQVTDYIQQKYGEKLLHVQTFRDDTTITIGPEDLRSIITDLKEHQDFKFNHLSSITGIDYSRYKYPGEWGDIRFGVVYNLFSYEKSISYAIRVVVPEDVDIPSVFDLWHGADWQEREVYDLFGVRFAGHPDLRRLFMYDDFEGEYPLRKDYPLRGKGERDRSWRHVQRAAKNGKEQ